MRPLNRPRLDEQQIVVGQIDIGPLKRLNRPRPNGLQTVVVQGGVEVVCIILGNYHIEPYIKTGACCRPVYATAQPTASSNHVAVVVVAFCPSKAMKG